jgi:hypothetical protein
MVQSCRIGTRYDLDNYKSLRYGSVRFDLLEVKHVWRLGVSTDKVFLMSFSGGPIHPLLCIPLP